MKKHTIYKKLFKKTACTLSAAMLASCLAVTPAAVYGQAAGENGLSKAYYSGYDDDYDSDDYDDDYDDDYNDNRYDDDNYNNDGYDNDGYDNDDYGYDGYGNDDYDYDNYDNDAYGNDDYDYDDGYDNDGYDDYSSNKTKAVPVAKRTPKQIKAYLKKNKISASGKTTYAKKPKTKSPYSAGKLSASTLKSALKTLNAVRYIAGLNADVKLNNNYVKLAQAASLVNAVNGVLSHSPSRPRGMSNSLYKLGAKGAGSSNIAMGYGNLNYALLNGWMADEDSSNIDRVGHRRWILNPSMGKTGFGMVGSYSAMYSFDRSGKGNQKNVFWPAQNMPLSFFDNNIPWSVSTGQSISKSKVKVVLTRISDGKKWTFSSKNKKSGYFNVNNDGYGMTGCIIFRPKNIKYKAKDKFKVKITGLPSGNLNYTVSFFK